MILAFDTETTGIDVFHGCRPFLITACDGVKNYYWWAIVDPWTRNVTWEQDDLEEFLKLTYKADRVVTHNGNFDIRMVAAAMTDLGLDPELWITMIFAKLEDTLVASHAVCSGDVHALKLLALKYLDVDPIEEQELHEAVKAAVNVARREGWCVAKAGHPHFPALKKQGTEFWKQDFWLCPEKCLKYALKDVEYTLRLWSIFKCELMKYSLWDQYRSRMELLKVAYNIQTCGRYFDVQTAQEKIEILNDEIEQHAVKLRKLSGITYRFNHEKKAHLKDLLHNYCKIPILYKTETGQPATDKVAIESYLKQYDHPALIELKTLKTKNKKKTDLVSLIKWVGPNGRTHSNLNVTGTRETRQSSSAPNDQNTDTSLKYLFIPEPGTVIIATDLVNIELRIWAYCCGNKDMIDMFKQGLSVHLAVMKVIMPEQYEAYLRIMHIDKDLMTPEQLKIAKWYSRIKNGNFALIYGATDKKANETYHGGKNPPNYCNIIRRKLPEIMDFMTRVHNQCLTNFKRERVFSIRTTGKQYPVPNYTPRKIGGYRLDVNPEKAYTAANYYIQGTAGWIMGDGMIAWSKHPIYRIYHCQMDSQIHDGLDTETPITPDLREIIIAKLRCISAAGENYIPTCDVTYKLKYHPTDKDNPIIQDLLNNPITNYRE
jgi:DNA polymerase I-like protein with 3'-5' exonuclease and polymerase domains